MWPDDRIRKLFGIDLPILQAPMGAFVSPEMVIAVSEAGGLGGLGLASASPEKARTDLGVVRQRTSRPINVNFFCHRPPSDDPARQEGWQRRLAPYYAELGLDPVQPSSATGIYAFDQARCDIVTEFRPEIVSFHFGLPDKHLLTQVKATGAKIVSSATTVDEARWLEAQGCDAIIAQGYEAGGHRGIFLTDDISTQAGTMALVPQVVDAVKIPVIAAGGIGDARGIAAAFALGAAGVQMGTAFLFCPEANVSPPHRAALAKARDNETTLTNVFTGRPARVLVNRLVREVGPMSDLAPPFPLAVNGFVPLAVKSGADGSSDFLPLWSGQAAALGRAQPAGELTRRLAAEALARLKPA
ncbi:MAG TPA: nitronate monooxygenase family protein [Vineibacter sp.]|nr:nitronate monooxygenase family protein [Vineibacter sp.]